MHVPSDEQFYDAADPTKPVSTLFTATTVSLVSLTGEFSGSRTSHFSRTTSIERDGSQSRRRCSSSPGQSTDLRRGNGLSQPWADRIITSLPLTKCVTHLACCNLERARFWPTSPTCSRLMRPSPVSAARAWRLTSSQAHALLRVFHSSLPSLRRHPRTIRQSAIS
jgi:hypothetical protein